MNVAIAGGGTGGHLFPGIALAQELSARGHTVFFIGNRGRIEQTKVPEYGFDIEFVRGGQVKGVGFLGALRGLWATAMGVLDALSVFARKKPDAVVGVGGYASVAGVMAAFFKGKRAVLCEQNSVPGRANRLLSKFVKTVFVAFPEAVRLLPERKTRIVGNPLRKGFRENFDAARKDARDFGRRLFVFGGSQGARKINYATVQAVQIWMERGVTPRIVHQTGELDFQDVVARYQAMGAEVRTEPFIDDMISAYARCDLIVARAGAMSIAEIAACGLPSILVPLPHAADDHQRHNAAALVDGGGALAIENNELDGKSLASAVDELFAKPEKLAEMGVTAKSLDRPDAARVICDHLESMV